MRIVVHHDKFYDWVPVPPDTKVTEHDIAARKVRPDAKGGGFLMRIEVGAKSHTLITVGEHTIVGKIIHVYCDFGKQGHVLTRQQAVARLLQENILPHHTNGRWMRHIEVEDDGPDEALFQAMLAPHLEADHGRGTGKNIDAEDAAALLAAYMTPHEAKAHVDHLHAHFRIQPKGPKGATP